jgi:hypothetical protein
MRAILAALMFGGLSSACGYLVNVTADLLFGATKSPKSLLDFLDGRRNL